MVSKETFTQHLAHEMAQAVVHRERYGCRRIRRGACFSLLAQKKLKRLL